MRAERGILHGLVGLLVVGLSMVVPGLAQPAAAATLTEVTNFGDNPGGMRMHIYVPDSRPANPAIVVAMHGCGGSGPGFYSGSEFASLADRYGFIVIYPTATQQAGFGNCFDTWSDAAKRRGGGSDPVSIMSMITYAAAAVRRRPEPGLRHRQLVRRHDDQPACSPSTRTCSRPAPRSWACRSTASPTPPTTRPAAASAPAATWTARPQQWGDAVRQAYPGYTGPRPRMQLWHGTNDTLVPYSLLQEAVEQWTNVFGLSQTPTSTDTPQPNWNRRRYADTSGTVQVEAYSIQGAGPQPADRRHGRGRHRVLRPLRHPAHVAAAELSAPDLAAAQLATAYLPAADVARHPPRHHRPAAPARRPIRRSTPGRVASRARSRSAPAPRPSTAGP